MERERVEGEGGGLNDKGLIKFLLSKGTYTREKAFLRHVLIEDSR
jgi:hypothetical protein